MARKRGRYQRRKELLERISDIFAALGIVCVSLVFVWVIVNNVIAVQNIRNLNLEVYTGSYSCELKRTYGKHRNYYYLIELDNGDTLSVSKSKCDNQQTLEECQILTFQYADDVYSRLFSSSYSALSIQSEDCKITILDLDASRRACVRSIWVLSILLFVWVSLFGSLCLAYYFAVIQDKHRKNRRKQRKTCILP